MNSIRLIILIVAVIIWQGIWIPNKVKRKIEKQVTYEGGDSIMKKQIKLYNLVFPIWMLVLFPLAWIIVLPANYIIDSIVVGAALKVTGVENKKCIYKQCIGAVWFFGFVADFIGAALLKGIGSADSMLAVDTNWWYDKVYYPIAYNPFSNIWSVVIVSFAVLVSAVVIYVLNRYFTFKTLEITLPQKKKIALMLAIITAPYLFFLPLDLFI